MYMGPIVATDVANVTRAPPPRVPASPALRLAAGVPVLLLAALVMLPWAAVIAVSAAVVLGARALLGTPRAFYQAADYAGRVALGR